MPISYSDGPYILEETFEVPIPELRAAESRQALAYWDQYRGERAMPSWRDVDFLDLPTTMIPSMIVVDVLGGENDFRYRFFGTGQVATHRSDLTGKRVSELPSEMYRAAVQKQYGDIVRKSAPAAFMLRALLNNVRYEAEVLRLPLCDDGEDVTRIWVVETVV